MEKNFETLEEGAWYKRRDGRVVGPVRKKKEKAKEDRNRYNFYVSIHTYTKKGFYLQTEYENKLDLIEKVEKPLSEPARAEPKTMPEVQPARNFEKLEEGGYYIRRDGAEVGPLEKRKLGENSTHPFTAYGVYYTNEGNFLNSGDHQLDLMQKIEGFRSVKKPIDANLEEGGSMEADVILNRIPHNPGATFTELEEGCYYRNRAGHILGPTGPSFIEPEGVFFDINHTAYRTNGKYGFTENPVSSDLLEKIETDRALELKSLYHSIDFDKAETDSMKDDIRLAETGINSYRGKLINASIEAADEALRARRLYKPYASPHEGYGILMEEVAELFDEIRKKEKDRDLDAMRKEATQVAAVALRFIVELTEP